MLRYKWHKKAEFGQDNEELSSCPERVTWLTFDQWLTFYNADPDHWEHMLNSNWDNARYYYLPVYRKNIYNSNQYRKWKYTYIKFLTRKDYRKYLTYKKELEKRGEDYENTQEVLALAKTVREEGAKRVEKIQKEQEEAMAAAQKFADSAAIAARANSISTKDLSCPSDNNSDRLIHLTNEFYLDKDTNQIITIRRKQADTPTLKPRTWEEII